MTIFEYAMYRRLAQAVTEDERQALEKLAKKADAGDENAASALRERMFEVFSGRKGGT